MPNQYIEIHFLEDMLNAHHFSIEFLEDDFPFTALSHRWIRFYLDGKSFTLMVDDEYNDFKLNKPVLNFCLVLRELEDYKEEDDILKWCNLKGLKTNESGMLDYYRDLGHLYNEVEFILGVIDPQISSLDFELNAGAAQALRRQD